MTNFPIRSATNMHIDRLETMTRAASQRIETLTSQRDYYRDMLSLRSQQWQEERTKANAVPKYEIWLVVSLCVNVIQLGLLCYLTCFSR